MGFISLPYSHPGIKPQLTLTPVTALCTSPSSDVALEELLPGDELNPAKEWIQVWVCVHVLCDQSTSCAESSTARE